MNGKQKSRFATALVGLMIAAGIGSAVGQQAAPTANKGITVKVLNAVDLGPEIEGMTGRQLRMRMITFEPGGVIALHDHKDRPATDYVAQGTVVDHRGSDSKVYGPGTSIAEDKTTVHWVENKGATPAILIAVDIFKQP